MWYSYYKLGQAEQAAKQFVKAISWYEKAAEKVKAMQESGRLAPKDKDVLKELEEAIAECRKLLEESK